MDTHSPKHILVVSYSQTGQLARLVENFLQPLRSQQNIIIEEYVVKPQQPYEFPWKFTPFFNEFPESVHLQPAPIEPPQLQRQHYDCLHGLVSLPLSTHHCIFAERARQTGATQHACDHPHRLS